jgi:urea transporter
VRAEPCALSHRACLFAQSATAMARLASVDDDMVSNGLASYNGALVGCAFAVFLPGSWAPEIALASAAGGAFTPMLAVALKNSLSMPQWTLAFNFTVLPPLLYHKPFSQPPPADAPAVITVPCSTLYAVDQTTSY